MIRPKALILDADGPLKHRQPIGSFHSRHARPEPDVEFADPAPTTYM
jgi:hypothetical protein